jgi:hypothetical protein
MTDLNQQQDHLYSSNLFFSSPINDQWPIPTHNADLYHTSPPLFIIKATRKGKKNEKNDLWNKSMKKKKIKSIICLGFFTL